MSFKMKDNTAALSGTFQQKASTFLRLIAEAIVNTSEKNTPMKSGDLRQRIIKQVLGLKGTITWNVDYAIFQEKKQFKNYTTPGTGPHFAENAVTQTIQNSAKIAREAGLA